MTIGRTQIQHTTGRDGAVPDPFASSPRIAVSHSRMPSTRYYRSTMREAVGVARHLDRLHRRAETRSCSIYDHEALRA